ncbi:MAG: ATP-binding protein [Planctomycetota bacterium]
MESAAVSDSPVPTANEGRILVVDDDKGIRTIIATVLKKAGFEIQQAGNGQEGLEIARSLRPDVIFSDWMMPVMDGLEFCRQVKADKELKNTLFVLLTAKTETEDKVSGLETGADDYLTKPFKHVEIIAKAKAGMRIRNLQKSLEVQNEELKRLHALKDEFLGMAAHDMRNPLSVIKLWSDSILEGIMGEVPEKQAHGVKIIMTHADNMLRLINDLLDIQKIESGKLVLDIKPFLIGELVTRFHVANRILAQDKGVDFTVDVQPGLAPVKLDEGKIGEVVNNLMSNSLKFCRKGDKVVIKVSAPQPGHQLVEVIDTGPGIRPEELPKLFGKFQQISTKATGGEKGTGLGLSICKKIVELHGGSIGVRSTFGEGATFHFSLPEAGPQSTATTQGA